jgi:hypothetical protein
MTLLGRIGLGLGLATIALAACGSDDKTPPPPASGSAGSSQAGAGNRSGSGNAGGDAAAAAGGVEQQPEGGSGGSGPIFGSIGGEFQEAEGGAPPNPPPRCDPATEWGNPVALANLSTPGADERLLGMTADERTLVFARDAQLYVADRDDATEDFAAPIEVVLPLEYGFENGLSLSADGLTLLVVKQDKLGFADISRTARGKTFDGSPSVSRFGLVNGVLTMSGVVAWPALSADGTLVLTRLEGTDQTGFRIRGEKFDDAVRIDSSTFGAVDGKHKLSQSLSSDARTLFFFDEDVGHAAALGSTTPRAAFTLRMELPGLLSAFASEGCERLYGTLEVDGSLDLVVETPN